MLTKRREKRNVFAKKDNDGNTLRVKQESEHVFAIGTEIIIQRYRKAVNARDSHRLDWRLEKEEEECIRQDERTFAIEEDWKIEGGVSQRIR